MYYFQVFHTRQLKGRSHEEIQNFFILVHTRSK